MVPCLQAAKKLSSKAKKCCATPPTQEDFDAAVCEDCSNIVLQAEVQRLILLKADALLVKNSMSGRIFSNNIPVQISLNSSLNSFSTTPMFYTGVVD